MLEKLRQLHNAKVKIVYEKTFYKGKNLNILKEIYFYWDEDGVPMDCPDSKLPSPDTLIHIPMPVEADDEILPPQQNNGRLIDILPPKEEMYVLTCSRS